MTTRRSFLKSAGPAAALNMFSTPGSAGRRERPNFVIIFLDDSGWADFRPFGSPAYSTPNVEQLARQGCSFHNCYVTQAVCSASRSSLLSGCYPGRTKVFGAHPPRARGLDPKFATMGEVLKAGATERPCSANGTSATSRTRVRPPGDSTSPAA